MAEAQFNLGVSYANGEGVAEDYVQAHKWLNLAAASQPSGEDRDEAVRTRDLVESRMTPSQVAEALRLAREWRPKTWDELAE